MYKKSKVFVALMLVAAMLVSTCSAVTYTVKKGDNLWRLSQKYDVSIQDIVDANPEIKDPNLIYVDQVLEIPEDGVSAADAIVGVTVEGFVDTDGAKASKIIVEYNVDLTGAEVTTDLYEVYNYGIAQGDAKCEIGSDPGKPVAATVDGNKVVIALNTDYQLGSVCKKYPAAMVAGVKQVKDLVVGDAAIKASDVEIKNYTHQVTENVKPNGDVSYDEWDLAVEGTYVIKGIDVYKLGTFSATKCFEEATGEIMDVELPYALYVPEDYDADKEYALAVQILDAGFLGADPMITLTESQACANFASAEIQQIVKDEHGLAGIIVVAPQIEEALRSTRDNWSLSAAVPATWQLLDYLTGEYSISMDHIYGTGQSMGGMQIVAMAAQRDNYFAGIWANGCQWGSNHNLEEPYKNEVYYEAPVDGKYITGVDADGNPVDYRNWYYMLSDDNVLITNCVGDAFSTTTWKELDYLYHDLAGTDLIFETYKATWNPLTASVEEQNAIAKAVMDKAAAESELGYVWTAFEGGNHMATWIYSHGVKAHYEWLLSQTQDTIEARGKLECLKNDFEYAEEQLTTDDRYIGDLDGEKCYFATGKLGAGTADYNGFWMNMGGKSVLKAPNWKAAPSIVRVTTEGFVDTDGAKAAKIIVEYNVDMTGAEVGIDTYEIFNYGIAQGDAKCEIGSNPGAATAVSVDGSKVIIELNTDYQLGSVCKKYHAAMAAGVKQVKDIVVGDVTLKASDVEVKNYTHQVVANVKPNGSVSYDEWDLAADGTFTFTDINDFQLFTLEDGTAFHATDCFEEATGECIDVDLPYALYVPEDYEEQVAAGKKFALMLHVLDAGFLGTDPMITLTESQASANYASDEVQQILKDQGLGGLIVVSPQIEEKLRSTRDNWSLSAAVPATWQLMDYLTETYEIDMNRIYGSGQSMGAMQCLAMAAQRDNYFAGILPIGCQWGNNYNLEVAYQGASYYEAPVDGVYITGIDDKGNEVDYRNWFYMISDDNILLLNCVGDAFSTGVWNELKWLYYDLCGVEFPKATWNPLELSQEEQNAIVRELVAQENQLGLYWGAFEGGNHMATWIYGHGVSAAYEWLFTQTKESADVREKLPLDKPFVAAAEQIQTAERTLAEGVYYKTGEYGSGTADYNSALFSMGGKVASGFHPGWTVEE